MNWAPVLWIYVVGAVLVGGFFYLVIWASDRAEDDGGDRRFVAEMRHYADAMNTTVKGMSLIFGLLWPMTLAYALTHLRNRGKK